MVSHIVLLNGVGVGEEKNLVGGGITYTGDWNKKKTMKILRINTVYRSQFSGFALLNVIPGTCFYCLYEGESKPSKRIDLILKTNDTIGNDSTNI